jgi:nucleotide-binding universal stress UspA family protein
MKFNKIVFPVDFSARSRGAARYVEALARRFHPAIRMVHVLPPPHYEAMSIEVSGPALAEVLAAREEHAKKQLAGFLTEEMAGFDVQRTLLDGEPGTRLAEYAAEEQADLIAISTHGYGIFRRFLLGSVAAQILHDAKCPVLTGVHMENAPPLDKIEFRDILVALDFTPESVKVLRWAADFAQEMGARLVVAHVAPSLEGQAGESFDPNWRDYFAASAKTSLEEMLGEVGLKDTAIVIDFGDPAHQVCELAAAERADLIVIGRGHSTEGMLGRLRAKAYSIIRMAPCPVISV